MTKRFKEHLIYEKDRDKVHIYLCLEDINYSKFATPLKKTAFQLSCNTAIVDLHNIFLESLYYDGCPSDRLEWFDTIDKAIDAFDSQDEI